MLRRLLVSEEISAAGGGVAASASSIRQRVQWTASRGSSAPQTGHVGLPALAERPIAESSGTGKMISCLRSQHKPGMRAFCPLASFGIPLGTPYFRNRKKSVPGWMGTMTDWVVPSSVTLPEKLDQLAEAASTLCCSIKPAEDDGQETTTVFVGVREIVKKGEPGVCKA